MTNAEKFEEVFGIKIDENHPDNPCGIFHHFVCVEHECNMKCPAYKFWERKYKMNNHNMENIPIK